MTGFISIFFAAFLWALDGVLFRPYLYHMNVVYVVFLEHVIALLIMFPFCFNDLSGEIKKLRLKDWLVFILIALFGGVIGTLAITKALFYVGFVPLSVPILIQKLQPIFALILSILLLGERPKKIFYLYAFMALLGSYFVTFGFNKPQFNLDNKTFIAALLGLLAAASWGSSTVFSKYGVSQVNYKVSTFLRFMLTSILMLPVLGLILVGQEDFLIFSFSQKEIIVLILIALFTGCLATFLYYFGLNKVPAAKATFYELSFPISAVALDFFIHEKTLSLGQIIGSLILIFSVLMINKNKQ